MTRLLRWLREQLRDDFAENYIRRIWPDDRKD